MAKTPKPEASADVKLPALPAVSAHFSTEEQIAEARFAQAVRRQAVFWLVACAVFVLFLWIFSSILLPFAAGMALAYFLDPVADRIERWTGSRVAATIIMVFGFLITLILAIVVIVPVLATQAAEFASRVPEYLAKLQAWITYLDPRWLEERFGVNPDNLRDALNSVVGGIAGFLADLVKSIVTSGMAIVNVFGLAVVTPVVAFYLLYDWDRMVQTIDNWIPRDNVETVREIARDIDSAIAGFVRGQGTVCLILGSFYAIALTVVGLNFGLLIGLFAGFIGFIPYVGSTVGLILSVGVALVQFWPEWSPVILVAAIFMGGQFFEGNILQPKLVGGSVGLHPVWLIFALLAFGSLFGFVGLLVAVPAAAAIAVLVRFAISRYLASPLYKGHPPARG